MNGHTVNYQLANSHNSTTRSNNTVPRLIALTTVIYLAAAPVSVYAFSGDPDALGPIATATVAGALGAGAGLNLSSGLALGSAVGQGMLLGASVAAVAVGTFTLAYCATSYVMSTDLCKSTNAETAGQIATAMTPQSSSSSTEFLYVTSWNYTTTRSTDADQACKQLMQDAEYANAFSGPPTVGTMPDGRLGCVMTVKDGRTYYTYLNKFQNPDYVPNQTTINKQDIGDNIAKNPLATAAIAAAAAAKARGASDEAASYAARAAAEATRTGNAARNYAAGNTAAAAAAAAAATEKAGGSPDDIKKAAKDAAQTAAKAAEKANPDEKTCTSNGQTLDNRFCTATDSAAKKTSLPAFCEWATTVCDFVTWTKSQVDDVTPVTATDTKLDIKKQHKDDTDLNGFNIDQQRVTFNAQCPAPVNFTFGFMGHSQDLSFKYDPLCDFMSKIRPLVIASSYLAGAYIVVGAARKED